MRVGNMYMKISRVIIENYRNLKNVDVTLGSTVTLIGENNSGKSNFMRAISIPLLSDDSGGSKRLSWHTITSFTANTLGNFPPLAYLQTIAINQRSYLSWSKKAPYILQRFPKKQNGWLIEKAWIQKE